MFSEITFSRKTFRTESTLKRLFPSVNAKVYYHMRVCGEGLFAHAAFMKTYTSVLALVNSEIALVDSAEITM